MQWGPAFFWRQPFPSTFPRPRLIECASGCSFLGMEALNPQWFILTLLGLVGWTWAPSRKSTVLQTLCSKQRAWFPEESSIFASARDAHDFSDASAWCIYQVDMSTRRGSRNFVGQPNWNNQRPSLSHWHFLSLKTLSSVHTLPRCYPEGFARRLKEAFENRTGFPRHMRFKMKIDRKLTDRELFEKMPLGDVWVDAKMHLVWKYIYSSKYVTIPSSWESAMRQFDSELTAAVTKLL